MVANKGRGGVQEVGMRECFAAQPMGRGVYRDAPRSARYRRHRIRSSPRTQSLSTLNFVARSNPVLDRNSVRTTGPRFGNTLDASRFGAPSAPRAVFATFLHSQSMANVSCAQSVTSMDRWWRPGTPAKPDVQQRMRQPPRDDAGTGR
jgi:hypothetical protein